MGSRRIGEKFTIHETLGEGGFGQVYRCTDEHGNVFAMKSVDLNNNGIPNPLELSVMSSIKHPNLNNAYKISVIDNECYIFMDLAQGDLSKIVRRDKNPEYKPNPITVKTWLQSICLGLASLHRQNIIHADIKASNILLFKDNVVRLSDYSCVVKIWKSSDRYNHTVGTSTHRPMENHLQRNWDKALDIWSLGVTFYEIVYGHLIFPYQGNLGKNRKDHILERCVNCLIDWAENGPRKQHCSIVPYKYNYHKFNLTSEFFQDPYGLNQLLLRMLSIDPAERPTIDQILDYPYFRGYHNPQTILVGTPTEMVKKSRIEKMRVIANNYGLGATVISLSIELYARTMNMPKRKPKDLRLLTCIWVATKIVKRKDLRVIRDSCCKTRNPKQSIQLDESAITQILEFEIELCSFLNFRLHYSSAISPSAYRVEAAIKRPQ